MRKVKKRTQREHKFAVGDRVVYNPLRTGNGWLAGEHGTVVYIDNTEACYTVEFNRPFYEGVTEHRIPHPKAYCGWFCKEENLTKE